MYIIEFNKRNIDLSKAEFLSLFPTSTFLEYGEYVFVESINLNNSHARSLLLRLAYTNSIYTVLFSSPYTLDSFDGVVSAISKYNLNAMITGSYALSFNSAIPAPLRKELLSLVWKHIENPVVNLDNPKHSLFFFNIRDALYCTERCFISAHSFTQRRAHLRTHLKPISLDPQLARCLVNLTGCGSQKKCTTASNEVSSNLPDKVSSKVFNKLSNKVFTEVSSKGSNAIVDPFCGTGGILIEAVLSGLHATGSDISHEMILLCQQEFVHRGFETSQYTVTVSDYFLSRKKIPYLVTDLPYGKSTKNVSSDFYVKVLQKSDSLVTTRAVIMVAEHLKILELLPTLTLKHLTLKSVYYYYVHGSLTRQILVFDAI